VKSVKFGLDFRSQSTLRRSGFETKQSIWNLKGTCTCCGSADYCVSPLQMWYSSVHTILRTLGYKITPPPAIRKNGQENWSIESSVA